MNNRFEISPDFTIERERTAGNNETVTVPVHNLIPERAAFIAAILAGARAELSMPSVSPSIERPPRTPGEPSCPKAR
jgi:hypothetical protein